MNYKININYDIDKLISIVKSEPKYKDKIIHGADSFSDFKKNTVLLGIRTTLENELKVSDIEALNYLMNFPLNFKLESFVELFKGINSANLTSNEVEHIFRLKFDFEKKKELIRQNFESTSTHIDVQEFLAWAENEGFIKLPISKKIKVFLLSIGESILKDSLMKFVFLLLSALLLLILSI